MRVAQTLLGILELRPATLPYHFYDAMVMNLDPLAQFAALAPVPRSQVPEIAQIYKMDKTKFEETAREWTAKYAM